MANAATRASMALRGIGAGIFAGLAAGGVAGVVNQIGQVAQGIAAIGDEAKRAGVSNRVFQEWAIVAEQARIPVDAMIDGLKELQLRGDEFAITGKGSAAEAFARLGYGAEELKSKLADPSALLLEIIDRLGKFDKAAQIRISDELFGGSAGERFVELLDQGAAGIRRTIDEAHTLGNVLSDEVIERAAEIDRQFKIISQTVGTALKGAIVNAATALQQFIDSFRNFEDQQDATLDARIAEIGAQQLALENRILKLKGQQHDGGLFSRDVSGDIAYLEEQRAGLLEEEAQIMRVIAARQKAREIAPLPAIGTPFLPPAYTPPPPSGSAARDASATKIERERQAVTDLIAELERELSLIGATDLQRQISNALRDAGAAATDDQRAKIAALITALHAEEQAQQKATDAKQEFASIASNAVTGFISDLRSGATEGEAFGNMISNIADRLIDLAVQMMIIKPLMSAFGLKGGGYVSTGTSPVSLATGGYVSGPGTSTSDSIPARLSDGEYVVNAAATKRNRALLEAINAGQIPRFASGGPVGRGDHPKGMAGASTGNITFAPATSITIEGGSRDPAADEKMANSVAANVERVLQEKMASFMMEQMRGGNALKRGSFA
ncbi:hypothetical protein [Aquibium oceanicum]|uniref:Uncharacterized protein n=1 Tax=Aquibium oceanicum TaxID=1670800 RepID=A0A1L3SU22_9HYPH|nr:hypothetical protein [Aquibium oceanicum]APH72884.1 hypothetical protein BSQ44_17060 [Aquibium oceanicum]